MDFNVGIRPDGKPLMFKYGDEGRIAVLEDLYKLGFANWKKYNIPIIQKAGNISQHLDLKLYKQDVILVGAGPSLKSQMKWLVKLSYLPFVIMIVDAAYKVCTQAGVRIDYALTAEVLGINSYFNCEYDGHSILLAYGGSGSARFWTGPVFFHDYVYDPKYLMNKTRKLPLFPTGFIITNTVLGMCAAQQARSVTMVGNNLCFKNRKKFYAYDWIDADTEENTKVRDNQILPVPGEKNLYTTYSYLLAAAWITNWINEISFKFIFINCSKPFIIRGMHQSTLKSIYKFMAGTDYFMQIIRYIDKYVGITKLFRFIKKLRKEKPLTEKEKERCKKMEDAKNE